MRGHVGERSAGVWRIWYDLGPDPVTGRRRQRSRTVHGSKTDAEKLRAIIVGQVAAGTLADPGQVTVAQFAERWLRLVADTVRPSTLDSYRQKLGTACALVGRRRLSDLSGEMLTGLYRTIPRSAQTVVHVHRVLHRMLADAVRWGLLQRNPASTAMPPKVRREGLTVWTSGEVHRFLELAQQHRLVVLFRLAVSTGMRRGELCALRWRAVDLTKGLLRVDGSTVMVDGHPQMSEPKTRAGRRRIALDPTTVQALEQHREAQGRDRLFFADTYRGDWVFCWEDGRPYSPDWVTHQFRELVDSSDLPRIRLHDLRHTWATLALEAGVPAKVVADRLGHAGIAITLDTYTHHVDSLDRAAALSVSELFETKPR